MPTPPTHIPDYDPRFFRTCIFPMLRRLGYGTRVTINNGLGPGQPLATDAHDVAQRVRPVREAHRHLAGDRASCSPARSQKLDVEALLDRHFGLDPDEDVLCMSPPGSARFEGQTSVEVDPKDLMAHIFVSDDFIEYPPAATAVSITGVAYQTGLLNDPRSAPRAAPSARRRR